MGFMSVISVDNYIHTSQCRHEQVSRCPLDLNRKTIRPNELKSAENRSSNVIILLSEQYPTAPWGEKKKKKRRFTVRQYVIQKFRVICADMPRDAMSRW